jgi:hypothetical protein
MSTIAELIENNLSLNTQTFKKDVDGVLLEIGPIINLVNQVSEDPGAVMNLLMKTVLAISAAASSVLYDKEKARLAREALKSSLYIRYGSSDPEVNPFAKTAKLTTAFIASVIEIDEDYIAANAAYQELKYLTSVIYGIKEVLEAELYVVKNLVINPGAIPMGGMLLPTEDIEAQLASFTEKFKSAK